MAVSEAVQLFQQRKFGMFIHWGLYAIPGGRHNGEVMSEIGEWFQARFRMSGKEYAKFAPQFNPIRFNADEWIRKAHAAGMRYIVFTSKHHDGFSMFDSKVSDYNIVKCTPFGRDPLRELSEACRKYGVGFGIYYSQNLDWHEENGGDPGPAYGMNCGNMPWGNNWEFPDRGKKNFELYWRGKVLPQVTELLTNYGDVCEFWCDTTLDMSETHSKELRALIKRLQPNCLINRRIGNNCHDIQGLGDNQLLQGKSEIPIESPGTLNNTWGFKYDDHAWKSAETIETQLVSLVEKNANYLLNVGPTALGEFTPETDRLFASLAQWMTSRADAVYGTSASPFPQELDGAYCTAKENKLNFFIKRHPKKLVLNGILSPVKGSSIPFRQEGGQLRLDLSAIPETEFLPVVTLTFDRKPEISQKFLPQNGVIILPAASAVIEKGDAAENTQYQFDDAGMRKEISTHAHKEVDGTISSWKNPGDRLSWPLEFLEPGTYRISILLQTGWKNQVWNGDRSVRIRWGKQLVEKHGLTPEQDFPSPYYQKKQSPLGTLTVEKAETGILILETSDVLTKESAEMKFTQLVLEK